MASSPPGPSMATPIASPKGLMQSSTAISIPTRTSSTSHTTAFSQNYVLSTGSTISPQTPKSQPRPVAESDWLASGSAGKRATGWRQLEQAQLQKQAANALAQSPPSASANANANTSAIKATKVEADSTSNLADSQSIPAALSQPHKRSHRHRNSGGSSLLPWASSIMSSNQHSSSSQQPAGTQTLPPRPPPAPDPSRYATEDFNFGAKRTWSAEKERLVRGPFDYLSEHPGKDFRTMVVKAFDAWLEVPPESLAIITRAIGMLHTASLLVDDVEDFSLLRRGFPVAHSIFGVPQTINSANYIYFCALQELQKLKNARAITIFAEELINLHRGQGMDLFWRDTLTCPTEDDYLEMVGNKTGGLFRLGIKLMQAESRSLIDCVPLVNLVGLIFQIGDDYKNLWSREYTDNKGMCEDLTEGKFSFPVIHSIRSDPANLQLLNILKQKTGNEEIKRYAVAYMESTGSFEYTRRVVAVLIDRARRLTDELDEGRGKSKGVHKILDKMVIDLS